jgi:YidC/Oxa1 family membrane protein insertase
MFFEVIFIVAQRFTYDPGVSIIVLSLVMNFLVLPLYKRADAMQAEQRDKEKELHPGVAQIKKAFSGDERMMILQEYYRQMHYKTTDALKGSVSLLLEIPFFIAAYHFLSHLTLLQGVPFGPIADLSMQDGLLQIGGMSVNLLPILMTCINLITCAIYTKGYPLKTKIQLYAMALFFLFFLYDSPSGLVFYWTLNNIFSLVKTIFYKLKRPGFVLAILSSITGIWLIFVGMFAPDILDANRIFLYLFGIALQYPFCRIKFLSKIHWKKESRKADAKQFLLAALLLSVILGVLIPSAVIQSSPQEFVDINYYHHPLWYIVSAFCEASGTCVIWFGVFYWLASPEGRVRFEKILWCLCGVSIMDYMFFGTKMGTLTSTLTYENGLSFSSWQWMANLGLVIVMWVVMSETYKRFRKFTIGALATGIIAVSGMSCLNLKDIYQSTSNLRAQSNEVTQSSPHFTLSKTKQNIVVIMLDRAMGPYVPYMFNEKPELLEQFSGFTYYSNTVSFGWHTNFGSPALFGGYEYTPSELNKRSSESLASKQNEALKVMPVLFDQNGYDVTVCDPVYANYQWIPDLSIYDDYPDIQAYITEGKFNNPVSKEAVFTSNCRNFFCYSIMKSSPLLFQDFLYDSGKYNRTEESDQYTTQVAQDHSNGQGIDLTFMNSYNVLKNLPQMTEIKDQDHGSFMMMDNDTTHAQVLLQEPEYEPQTVVNNTEYDAANTERFTVNGRTMAMDDLSQYQTYEINMAAMIQLGNWFDYLKENGVYDNTRIILVADHGFPLGQFDELDFTNMVGTHEDMESYTPLLMVKDFNAKEFNTSDAFMTNGDVPSLATEGTVEEAVNPFTGEELDSDEKTEHPQYIISSYDWQTTVNNGNVFFPANWYSLTDNVWDINNWKEESHYSTSPTENKK